MTGCDGKIRSLKARADGHVGEHGYGVQFSVVGSAGRRYVPWCHCGWTGMAMGNEKAAAAEAFHHATGRWPDIDTAPARRTPPLGGCARPVRPVRLRQTSVAVR